MGILIGHLGLASGQEGSSWGGIVNTRVVPLEEDMLPLLQKYPEPKLEAKLIILPVAVKRLPLIVTVVLTAPEVGLRLLIAGAFFWVATTVNARELLVPLALVTEIL